MTISSTATVAWEEMATVKLQITEVVEFGTAMMDVFSAEVATPPQGVRANVNFTGSATGVLAGTMSGTDHLNIRADGRSELNIHAVIVTPDGARIAYEAGGVTVPGEGGIGFITETAKLTTSFEKYAWVNGLTFVAKGTVNLESGEINLVLSK